MAVYGSRCARHWLRRQAAYRKLPTETLWWRKFEAAFVAGLELRPLVGYGGQVDSLRELILTRRKTEQWMVLIKQIVEAADAVIRRQHVARGGSEEEAG